MGKTTANPWLVDQVDPLLAGRLAARHVPTSGSRTSAA